MRLDEAAARLEPLPDPFPPPLDALMPVRTDGGNAEGTGTNGVPAAVRPQSVCSSIPMTRERPGSF